MFKPIDIDSFQPNSYVAFSIQYNERYKNVAIVVV